MALRLMRWLAIASAVAFVLIPPNAIFGCGPFFDEAVFVPPKGPQVSQKDFAAGKLGIVLPTLRRTYLVVAYRYLSGLSLAGAQQQDAIDVWNRNVGSNPQASQEDGPAVWRNARNQVPGVRSPSDAYSYAPLSVEQPYQTFLNCPQDAFRAAAATLADRIQKYRADSAAVREWLAAQDQVFADCDGKTQLIPAALAAKDPLLRSDRNYQIAAAEFYARKFDDAAISFDAVAQDSTSPWASIASYLAARALIRKASLATAESDKFDLPMMQAAQQRLQQVLSDPRAASMHGAAKHLLDYVRFRTEPEKRVAELEQIMLKPDPGPEFRQHFWDYALLLAQGERADDLSDWLHTVYVDWTPQPSSATPNPDAAEHAVREWRERHSLPWLIAALELTAAGDKNAAELLEAASGVPANSPGYLTVRYYALRLMAGANQDEARRQALDALLAAPELAAGTRNMFNDERLKLATSLPDFLAHAAEAPSAIGYDEQEMTGGDEQEQSEQTKRYGGKLFFNAYSAGILGQGMPTELLIKAARSPALPDSLRREIARSTWMRAVLIGDLAAADQLQPALEQLDHPLWKMMEPFRTTTGSERRFTASLIALQNPGLRPSVRAGLPRSETLGTIDSFHDNWWCEERGERGPEVVAPFFLTSRDRNDALAQQEKLSQTAIAPNYLSSEVVTYAEQHPENPWVPQALYLSVRATRYGCANRETTRWSEKAFRLLHQRYPKSPWTEKTKYHY